MPTHRFADVILPLANDVPLVLLALQRHCPKALEWCRKVTVSPLTMAEAVVEALPAALDVGIREKIATAWWLMHKGPGPWPAEFDLETSAALEQLDEGLPVMALRLQARLHLSQSGANVYLQDGEHCQPPQPQLLLGEPRAWVATWTLSLTDGRDIQLQQELQEFCRGSASVHIIPVNLPVEDSVQI